MTLLRVRRLRRRSPLLLGVSAAAALMATLPSPAGAAAARSKLTARPSTAALTVGIPLTVNGSIRPIGVRRVRLEQRSGGTWVRLASAKTTKPRGNYRITTPVLTKPGKLTLRVVAPRTSKAKALRTKTFTVTVSASTTPKPGTPTPSPKPTVTPAPTPLPPPAVTTPSSALPSFRALHVVASDQAAAPDYPAKIRSVSESVNTWFGTQTSGNVRPRWVRDSGGQIVVSVVPMTKPKSAYDVMDFLALVAEIDARAPSPSNQRSVVWFDVKSALGCGAAYNGYAVMLEDQCGIHAEEGHTFPYGPTYLVGHEMAHVFGAVPSCAPHHGSTGHVTDDPKDLLYAGPTARDWANITLDPGHDDYYLTGNPGCPGIESSPYWTATSDPLS